MSISKEKQRKNIAKNEEMNPKFIFGAKNEFGFILISIDTFPESKVKIERISFRIGRLLAYEWME